MAITIKYGTHGTETQEEAANRFWAPAVKYADKLLKDKTERNRITDQGIEHDQ